MPDSDAELDRLRKRIDYLEAELDRSSAADRPPSVTSPYRRPDYLDDPAPVTESVRYWDEWETSRSGETGYSSDRPAPNRTAGQTAFKRDYGIRIIRQMTFTSLELLRLSADSAFTVADRIKGTYSPDAKKSGWGVGRRDSSSSHVDRRRDTHSAARGPVTRSSADRRPTSRDPSGSKRDRGVSGQRLPGWVAVALRFALGAAFIYHGFWKLFDGETHAGLIDLLARSIIPFPEIAVWVTGVTELAGGLALVLGVFATTAAVLLAIDVTVGILALYVPLALANTRAANVLGADAFYTLPAMEVGALYLAGLLLLILGSPARDEKVPRR